jgi:hypothetical protein
VEHRLPRRKLAREQAPLATALQDIIDCVKDLARAVGARACGDMGLNVFAKDASGASYPKSQQVGCASLLAGSTDQIEQTLSGEASGLSYDATSGRYTYAWKSNKGWKGTCRRFIVEFKDGTQKEAYFQFTK